MDCRPMPKLNKLELKTVKCSCSPNIFLLGIYFLISISYRSGLKALNMLNFTITHIILLLTGIEHLIRAKVPSSKLVADYIFLLVLYFQTSISRRSGVKERLQRFYNFSNLFVIDWRVLPKLSQLELKFRLGMRFLWNKNWVGPLIAVIFYNYRAGAARVSKILKNTNAIV